MLTRSTVKTRITIMTRGFLAVVTVVVRVFLAVGIFIDWVVFGWLVDRSICCFFLLQQVFPCSKLATFSFVYLCLCLFSFLFFFVLL